VGELSNRNFELLGLGACVPGSSAAGKSDDQIGLAVAQHPIVPDQSRVPRVFGPIGGELNEFKFTRGCPFASDPIHAACVAFDQDFEAVLSMQAI
jgi:hypothetical protein